MKKLLLPLTLFASISFLSCNKEINTDSTHKASSTNETFPFEFKGLLKKQGPTTYMYGTHVISNNGQVYALKSTTVNLDAYVDKTVTVKGYKINGYPVENGPEYIDVKAIQ